MATEQPVDQLHTPINSKILPMAAICAPIFFAFGLLAHFTSSFPCQDDFHAILEFGLRYRQLSNPWSRLGYILSAQYVDYKLIFEHCLLVLQFSLLGHVSFKFLVIAGNLFVLAILFAVWKMCFPTERNLRKRLLLFVPVTLLLLSLNYSETLDWAMAGLQNLPAVFFSMMALYILSCTHAESNEKAHNGRSTRHFCLACLFAILAPASSANGFLLTPIGLCFLLLQRQIWRSATWFVLFLPLTAAYLYHYRVMLPVAQVPLYTKPLFMLAVLGTAAPQSLIVGFGFLFLWVWIWSFRKLYFAQNPYAVLVSVWVIGTALMIAAGRGNYGLGAAYASRYKIYSDLALIFCYGYIVTQIDHSAIPARRRRILYQVIVCLALLYCIRGNLSAWRLLRQRKADIEAGMSAWTRNPATNSPMFISDVVVQQAQALKEDEASRRILNEAVATGLYTPNVK